ncbi:hypothetical protein GCM10028799_25730 [Kribbella italica]
MVPSFAFGGATGLGFGFGVGVGVGLGVSLGVGDEADVLGAVALGPDALGAPESSPEPQAVRSRATASVAVITFMVAILP